MNFARFVSMLEHGGLFFCPVDKLGDPFEGSIPRRWIEKSELKEAAVLEGAPREVVVAGSIDALKKLRPWTLVNCWHMNEAESVAMWKLYCQNGDGICIQSRYELLNSCIGGDVFLGKVKYISYETDTIPLGNLFWPFTHKRKSFEHERELRAILCDVTTAMEGIKPAPVGEWRALDLNMLVESIYVAPTAAAWFVELICDVMTKYGLIKPVHNSAIDAEPLF